MKQRFIDLSLYAMGIIVVLGVGVMMQVGQPKTIMPIITDDGVTMNSVECRNPYDTLGFEPMCQEYCNSLGGQVWNQWATHPYWTTCFIEQPAVSYVPPDVE